MPKLSISLIVITMVYSFTLYSKVGCVEFNRRLTGVCFSPYVLNQTVNTFSTYSMKNIETMLKVISTRFSRILTYSTTTGVAHTPAIIKPFSEVFTAEAAAMLNMAANSSGDNLNLGVFIGIYLYSDPERMKTEKAFAFEAVRKSNNIYPGTTLGIAITHRYVSSNASIANLAVHQAQYMREEAMSLNLTIGIKVPCESFVNILNTSEESLTLLDKTRKEYLQKFDFIICQWYDSNHGDLGAHNTTDSVMNEILLIRDRIHSINPNIEIMVQLQTEGTTEKRRLDLWTMMDRWGTRNNISVWMQEAFDNPWRGSSDPLRAKLGWWKLKTNLAINDLSGYEEKIIRYSMSENVSISSAESFSVEKTVSTPKNFTILNTSSENSAESQYIFDDNGTTYWLYISSIIGPTVVVVSVVIFAIHCVRLNNNRRKVISKNEIKRFVKGSTKHNESDLNNEEIEMQALQKPYDKSFEVPKKQFRICWSSILGCGEFGVVYKAHILDLDGNLTKQVAVKMTDSNCPKYALLSILAEIKILLYLGHHENIVSIQGAYTAEVGKGVAYVATDLCELGCLKDFLRRFDKTGKQLSQFNGEDGLVLTIDFIDLVQWSYEIACGMEYVEEKNVIHGDLATRNILLTVDKKAKITDFGLSRHLYECSEYIKKNEEPLPWRWMAIEVLRKKEFSLQSDVWSLGITLWEIFSMADVPYPGVTWSMDFVDSLENGLRMPCPNLASQQIYNLMSTCWEQEPQNRPTFAQLRQSIGRIIVEGRKESSNYENC